MYNVVRKYESTFESTTYCTEVLSKVLSYESTSVRKYNYNYFRTEVRKSYGSTFVLLLPEVPSYEGTFVVRTYFRTSYFRTYIATYYIDYIHYVCHTYYFHSYEGTFVLSYVRRYVTSTCTYIRIQNIVVLREYGSTLFTVRVHVRTKYEGTSGSTKEVRKLQVNDNISVPSKVLYVYNALRVLTNSCTCTRTVTDPTHATWARRVTAHKRVLLLLADVRMFCPDG